MSEIHTSAAQVLERIEDAFFAVDEDGCFTYLNEQAETVLEVDRESVVGEYIWDVFEPAVGTTFQKEYDRAMETQESVSFEEYYPPLETWFKVNIYPSASGLSVYFDDVTDRVEREAELVQVRDLLKQTERIAHVGGWEIDVESMDVFWTEHLFELLDVDYDEEPQLDEALDIYLESDRPKIEDAVEQAIDCAEPFDVEARFHTADGEIRWLRVQGSPKLEDGEVVTLRGAAQDITTRKRREQQLELYERVVDTVEDGVYATNEDDEFIMVNDALCEMTGYNRAALLGNPYSMLTDGAVQEQTEQLFADLVAGRRNEATLEFDLQTTDGETIPVESRFDVCSLDDSIGRCSVVRDISDRNQFEQRLVSLHGTARTLFRAGTEDAIIETATDALREILDVPAAGYFRYDPESGRLSSPAEADTPQLIDADLPAVSSGSDSVVRSVFETDSSRRIDDLTTVAAYDGGTSELDLRSLVLAPVDRSGVLIAGAETTDAFDDSTQQLVDIVATNAAAAFDRVEYEQTLRARRDRLAALNDIDSLIHNLSESIFGLTSKAEIEAQICERLADSESYEFAWIGIVEDGQVVLEHESGVEDYLSDLALRVDVPPEDLGPTAQAHRTGEMQVVQNIETDPRYEQWRDHARAHGYRASASIPIGDEEPYSTLNLYSSRANAFGDEERDALRRLGAIIGYALSSVERDRQLQRERNRLDFMNRLLRHNLLNSLNVVNARLQRLDGRVDFEVRSDLEIATDRTREMIEFVQTAREVTKVVARTDEQELRARAIDDVLETRVKRAQDTYPDAEYNLESLPDVAVLADDLLEEVLDNVLENAVQHNPDPDPTVWVDVNVGPERVEVSIADDGPGIHDAETASIFDRESANFDDPGSGFGLHLVSEIMASYGGDIVLEANSADGARFCLLFERP